MTAPFRPTAGSHRRSTVLAELAGLWDRASRARAAHNKRTTQAALASTAGLPVPTINSWSKGRSSPQVLDQLVKVGRVLADWAGEPPRTGVEWSRLMDLDQTIAADPLPETVPVPAQLPLDVSSFVGRAHELDRLAGLLADGGTVVVAAIDGTAGIGKTALAVHAAHRWRDRFPGGQLYVNLGGPTNDPVDVLEGFLRDLGCSADKILPRAEDRIRQYRTLLAERRVLVVLDNATSEAQVRPLLPGTGSSAVVITSRNSLAGLEIGGHARITLDTLGPVEAIDVLASIAGADRIRAEAEAAERVIELCDRLPLALSISGHLLVVRQKWTIARLADRLSDQRRRLDELEVGDRGVRAAFTVSYDQLKPAHARMFRLLGLHPGRDVTAPVAAALASVIEPAATRTLNALAQNHLVREDTPDRFKMHALLRLFAEERARQEEEASSRDAAVRRMFTYYRDLAAQLGQRWHDTEDSEPWGDGFEVLASVAAEHENITAVALLAASWERETLWRIADNMLSLLVDRRFFAAVFPIFHAVRDTAHEAGAVPLEFRALIALGNAYCETRQPTKAVSLLEEALALARTNNIRWAERMARNDLALAYKARGDHDKAIENLRIAAELAGNPDDQARAWGNLAATYVDMGRPDLARVPQQRALQIFEDDGRARDKALSLMNMARMQARQNQFDEAMINCDAGLAVARDSGDRHLEGLALHLKGNIHLLRGDDASAATCHRQAVNIFDDTDPTFAQIIKMVAPPEPGEAPETSA